MNRAFSSLVLAADTDGPRVVGYQQALERFGLPPARALSYEAVLARGLALEEALDAHCIVRLESPGKRPSLEAALITLGGGAEDRDLSIEASPTASHDIQQGELRAPARWYRGWSLLLDRIVISLASRGDVKLTNHPHDVALFFDKAACAHRLAMAGVSVPPSLPPTLDYDELRAAMSSAGWERVFVKLRYGSTASGIVALAARGSNVVARTTVEWVDGDPHPTLYNSRRVRTYTDERTVARVIDWILREGAHVERWIPKANIDGRTFDLRIVTVAGEPTHAIGRGSRGPFTNLQLGGERLEIARVVDAVGRDRWNAIEATCCRVASLFPRTLHLGIDVLVSVGGRNHYVAEVNAFGDLLPGLVDARGDGTYDAEVRALAERRFPSEGPIECTT